MKNLRNLALLAALALVTIAGCGGTNNTPPGTDAGHDAFVSTNDTGPHPGDGGADGGSDSGNDTGVPPTDGGPDTGPCVSTMPHCNTCTTAATDPLNACSSYVTGCIPFDNATRVPGWPDHIPAITP